MSDDTISRQAAIDIADKFSDADECNGSDVATDIISGLISLPSVQSEIIRCKDCKHKHLENMVWTCPFGLPGGENFF